MQCDSWVVLKPRGQRRLGGAAVQRDDNRRMGRARGYRSFKLRQPADWMAVEFVENVADDDAGPLRDRAAIDRGDQDAGSIRLFGGSGHCNTADAKFKFGRRADGTCLSE